MYNMCMRMTIACHMRMHMCMHMCMCMCMCMCIMCKAYDMCMCMCLCLCMCMCIMCKAYDGHVLHSQGAPHACRTHACRMHAACMPHACLCAHDARSVCIRIGGCNETPYSRHLALHLALHLCGTPLLYLDSGLTLALRGSTVPLLPPWCRHRGRRQQRGGRHEPRPGAGRHRPGWG